MEALFRRRSIRKYTDHPVDDHQIKNLLKAAMSAPSAGNQQPWHFIVIRDKTVLDRIPDIHPYSKMVPQAQAVILICGDPTLEKHKDYWVQDCSAATENVLIQAVDEKLGGVWLGVYPREDRVSGLRELLRLPDHVIPFALIPIGYPAEEKDPPDRYDPSRVHYNQW